MSKNSDEKKLTKPSSGVPTQINLGPSTSMDLSWLSEDERKALLIDYPNASDRDAYFRNQQNGLIPSGVGIGGRIEIHGGGNDVVTDGCIGMTDREIDLLYELVDVGTPVTIIGAKRSLKSILEGGNGN